MRSFLPVAALLANALTSVAQSHGGHHHAHNVVRDARLHIEKNEDPVEAEKLRRREIYARNEDATAAGLATNWFDTAFGGNDYAQQCLDDHNEKRRMHGTPDVEWDSMLAYLAQVYVSSCIYAHDQSYDPLAGQNMAAGIDARNISGVLKGLWYDSEISIYWPLFGQPDPPLEGFHEWAHVTQVLWYGTTHVGCATQYCPMGLANAGEDVDPYFTICNYKAAGNVYGEYDRNVLPPMQSY